MNATKKLKSVLTVAAAVAGLMAMAETTSPAALQAAQAAGVQLWANGPRWAEVNLGAETPEGEGGLFEFKEAAKAVKSRLGPGWRLPTRFEFDTLCGNDGKDSCTWRWDNARRGYVITGKTPGYTDKSIFLPAAGCDYGSGREYAGSHGRYWSSGTLGKLRGWNLFFGPCYFYMNDNINENRLTIRAVRAGAR